MMFRRFQISVNDPQRAPSRAHQQSARYTAASR
jgi:hypothetical protein